MGERVKMGERVERREPLGAEPLPAAVVLAPGSAFEAVTRQMVEDLAREIGEIKGRLNGLLFMAAGAIVVDVVMRLSGA
jgi:hypothetical protein